MPSCGELQGEVGRLSALFGLAHQGGQYSSTLRSLLSTILTPILRALHKLQKPTVQSTPPDRTGCLPATWYSIPECSARPTLVYSFQSAHTQPNLLGMDVPFYEHGSTIVSDRDPNFFGGDISMQGAAGDLLWAVASHDMLPGMPL